MTNQLLGQIILRPSCYINTIDIKLIPLSSTSTLRAVARGGGGLSPPPPLGREVHPGRQIFTYNANNQFDTKERPILRLEYTTFFKISPTPLDRLRTFGARMKRSALSESSPNLSQNLATALPLFKLVSLSLWY